MLLVIFLQLVILHSALTLEHHATRPLISKSRVAAVILATQVKRDEPKKIRVVDISVDLNPNTLQATGNVGDAFVGFSRAIWGFLVVFAWSVWKK